MDVKSTTEKMNSQIRTAIHYYVGTVVMNLNTYKRYMHYKKHDNVLLSSQSHVQHTSWIFSYCLTSKIELQLTIDIFTRPNALSSIDLLLIE
jgi:hypothetical protein